MKYRLIKAGEKYLVQKKRFIFGGWKTLSDNYMLYDAIAYFAKVNPKYEPPKEDILLQDK